MNGNNQNLYTECDKDENITSFAKLSSHPQISTTSETKISYRLELMELFKHYKESKEKFFCNINELIRVSSLLRRDKLVAISAENYKEICKENLTGQNNDRLSVSFPDDIELVEKLSQYSVDKLDKLMISFKFRCEEKQGTIQKFLFSFGYTKIKQFEFNGYNYK